MKILFTSFVRNLTGTITQSSQDNKCTVSDTSIWCSINWRMPTLAKNGPFLAKIFWRASQILHCGHPHFFSVFLAKCLVTNSVIFSVTFSVRKKWPHLRKSDHTWGNFESVPQMDQLESNMPSNNGHSPIHWPGRFASIFTYRAQRCRYIWAFRAQLGRFIWTFPRAARPLPKAVCNPASKIR